MAGLPADEWALIRAMEQVRLDEERAKEQREIREREAALRKMLDEQRIQQVARRTHERDEEVGYAKNLGAQARLACRMRVGGRSPRVLADRQRQEWEAEQAKRREEARRHAEEEKRIRDAQLEDVRRRREAELREQRAEEERQLREAQKALKVLACLSAWWTCPVRIADACSPTAVLCSWKRIAAAVRERSSGGSTSWCVAAAPGDVAHCPWGWLPCHRRSRRMGA